MVRISVEAIPPNDARRPCIGDNRHQTEPPTLAPRSNVSTTNTFYIKSAADDARIAMAKQVATTAAFSKTAANQ